MLRVLGLALLLTANLCSLGECQSIGTTKVPSTQGRSTPMNESDANKRIIRTLFEEWINKKNLAAVDQMVTANYVDHEGGRIGNSENTKKFLAALYNSFPDIQVTIEDIFSEGDKVIVRNTWRGTDKGGFRGMPATGKSVVVEGIVIWRIEGGKVAERWAVIDYFGLTQQLASVPVRAH